MNLEKQTPIDLDSVAEHALVDAITRACGQQGGSCNYTPTQRRMVKVCATFDPREVAIAVVMAVREAERRNSRAPHTLNPVACGNPESAAG